MRLFCIIRSLDDKRFPTRAYSLLEKACHDRGVDFIPVEAEKIDFTELPILGKGDMLYRITTDAQSRNVQAHLLKDGVASFLIEGIRSFPAESWPSTTAHRNNDLPIIPTIIDLPKDRKLLDKYVKNLGGYPIVVKVQGGSHGIGVMRADSSDALYSLVDYLRNMSDADAALRKYIDFSAHARLIVLGDKVIDSIEYVRPKGDFRSNVGLRPEVVHRKFSAGINKAAIKAAHVIGYDFGGVDILIDHKQDKFYIAEVNFPCNFARSQDMTGIDIAGAMVDYLIKKVRK